MKRWKLAGKTQKVTSFADEHALSYFNEEQIKYIGIDNWFIKVDIAENGDPSQTSLHF